MFYMMAIISHTIPAFKEATGSLATAVTGFAVAFKGRRTKVVLSMKKTHYDSKVPGKFQLPNLQELQSW